MKCSPEWQDEMFLVHLGIEKFKNDTKTKNAQVVGRKGGSMVQKLL